MVKLLPFGPEELDYFQRRSDRKKERKAATDDEVDSEQLPFSLNESLAKRSGCLSLMNDGME